MQKYREEIWNESQSNHFAGDYSFAGRMIRIRIKRDSHGFQSYAIAEVLHEAKWNIIASIPYPFIKVEHSPHGTNCINDYRKDIERLKADCERLLLSPAV